MGCRVSGAAVGITGEVGSGLVPGLKGQGASKRLAAMMKEERRAKKVEGHGETRSKTAVNHTKSKHQPETIIWTRFCRPGGVGRF